MVKLLGSLCVFCGGMLVWWNHMAEQRRKRDTLAELTTALRRMKEEIRMARTPLPRLLEALSKDCRMEGTAALFHKSAQAARLGEGLRDVWRQMVQFLPLEPRERRIVGQLELYGDEENVCKGISLVIRELEKCADEWEKRRPEETKRTSALCFSGAALLVILLM